MRESSEILDCLIFCVGAGGADKNLESHRALKRSPFVYS